MRRRLPRLSRNELALGVALIAAGAVALAGAAAPAAAARVKSDSTTRTVQPGLAGTPFTVADHVALNGGNHAYDMATDASGTTYLGWIAGSSDREIDLCTLPPHATACEGGVQSVDSGSPTASDIRVLSTPGGAVTIVFYMDSSPTGYIAETTSQAGAALTPITTTATTDDERNGTLLDAEYGPGGQIWTVVYPGLTSKVLDVRATVTSAPVSVTVPYAVGFGSLAFDGSTPILVITEYGEIGTPVAYAYQPDDSWTSFKNVAGTWAIATNVGLTSTGSGVRLTTGIAQDGGSYSPVVANWNGHGFSRRQLTGDDNSCAPNSHDTGTDASGRLVDVTDECGKITVSDLVDTQHAAIFRFTDGGSEGGGDPQISTSPRGDGWVAWSIESNSGSGGDRLQVVPIRLAGLQRKVTAHGHHGAVTLTGPVSCLPAVSLPVSIKGHPSKGWKALPGKLTLSGHKIGSSIDGAALKAGKTYTLKGTVTFSNGHEHSNTSADIKFLSCPNA